MLKINFIILLRNIWRNKISSFINISGLALGLTCCVFIAVYIYDETSYDKNFENSDRIYRVTAELQGAQNTSLASVSPPYAEYLQKDFPEIEKTARLWKLETVDKHLVKVLQNDSVTSSFFEGEGYMVDAGFFDVFSYQFLYGNKSTALQQGNTVVISNDMAGRLFGNIDPIGRMIQVENGWGVYKLTVTGVFKKELHSHINANFFITMYSGEAGDWAKKNNKDWAGSNMFFTYVKVKPGTNVRNLVKKFPSFLNTYAATNLKAAGITKQLDLQPLTSIHLNSKYINDISVNGDIKWIYILGSIGFFILILACINYMNLATARATKRAREIGVRKVLGANRSLLAKQFLSESVLMSILSFFLVTFLVMLLLQPFENVSGKTIDASQFTGILLCAFLLSLITGIVAGIYPAIYLSSFNAVEVIKNNYVKNSGAAGLRRGLIVFQFVISITLIASMLVIWQQIRFLKNTELGFNKDQQMVIHLKTVEAEEKYPLLKEAFSKQSNIISISAGTSYPGIFNPFDINLYPQGKSIEQGVNIKLTIADEGFAETLGMTLLKGRFLSKKFATDTGRAIVLNESALNSLNIPISEAIGKKLVAQRRSKMFEYMIVGVIKDFHYETLHRKIEPYALVMPPSPQFAYMVSTIKTTDMPLLLSAIKKEWKTILPQVPFEYSFLDEEFQKNYEAEHRVSQLIKIFTGLAIIISCLGLYGLAVFVAAQRKKEIGVRKVLGASVNSIVMLFSKDFIRLVVVALLIATPLSWWAMSNWLETFVYRIDLSWWMFALAGLLAIVTALITVSFQSLKAALMNPVKSLRTE